MLCPVGAVKSLENRILLKSLLVGVASAAYFITGHGQTQSNRVCYFLFFGYFLDSKGSSYSELIALIIIEVMFVGSELHYMSVLE